VRRPVPRARLVLVGSDPRTDLLRAAAQDPTVTVTGRVDDVRPYLWEAAVAVAPLLTARGVQSKVLEATAAGLPSVVTSVVFAGLPEEVRPACVVADNPEGFSLAIIQMLNRPPHERRAKAASTDLMTLTWDNSLEPLLPILESARAAS
jgi:glycosyltransferase involved in cell wall biosynthesis